MVDREFTDVRADRGRYARPQTGPSVEVAPCASRDPRRLLTPAPGARAGTLDVAADSAAGLLWHALAPPRPAPSTAQWSWKVELGVRPTDLTRRGEDDRILAVYFVFGATGDAAKGPTALLSASSTRALVYVFGGNAPRSSLLASPHMGERGKFIVLQPADTPKQQWLQESVDPKADYIRAFGQLPDHLLAVAISSDSDDTRGHNRAQLRGLRIDR